MKFISKKPPVFSFSHQTFKNLFATFSSKRTSLVIVEIDVQRHLLMSCLTSTDKAMLS